MTTAPTPTLRDDSAPSGETTVELFVRSLAPSDDCGHAEAVIRRLDDLADRPLEYEVHVWGEAVGLEPPLADTDPARFVLDRVASFREWAERNDAELVGFEARETRCEFTDSHLRLLSLPTVVLATYRNDDLVGVAPVRTPDGTVSVEEYLDRVAADMDEAGRLAGT